MSGTPRLKVLRLIYQSSQRYEDQAQRYELFRTAIHKATRSIGILVREVSIQGQQHGKLRGNNEPADPEEKRSVRAEHLVELEKAAALKIEEWAADGRLRSHPTLIPFCMHGGGGQGMARGGLVPSSMT